MINIVKRIFSRKECLLILKNNGYVYDHSTGGHSIYKKGNSTISIPSININPMLFRRLMKENNLKEIY